MDRASQYIITDQPTLTEKEWKTALASMPKDAAYAFHRFRRDRATLANIAVELKITQEQALHLTSKGLKSFANWLDERDQRKTCS